MAMNRILEFTPSQEEAVVSRILVLIHQAVDEAFPSVAQNNRQFTKTVFSDGESTAIGRPGGEDTSLVGRPAFAGDEDTANDLRPDAADGSAAGSPEIPPPPSHREAPRSASPTQPQARRPDPPPRPTAATGFSNHPQPVRQPRSTVENRSAATNLDATMEGLDKDSRPDWVSRILIAVFIAGAILLAYSMFVAP